MGIKFNNYLVFGGLEKLNDNSIFLREKQINDNVKIHSCNDYDKSLEVIKEANSKKENISLILKDYFNYPDKKNRRYRPILSQIEEAILRLNFIPSEFILQMCCYFPMSILKKNYFMHFLAKIRNDFGIRKIFFEYYPSYKYDFRAIKYFNDRLDNDFTLGLTGYFNYWNRVINIEQFNSLMALKIPFIPIGILGKNLKRDKMINKINFVEKEIYDIDYIDQNLIFFIKQILMNRYPFYGITGTSKYSNYLDLKFRLKRLYLKKEKINRKVIDDNTFFNYIKNDHYGGRFFYNYYLSNPKKIISNFKNKLLYRKSKIYFFK